MSKSRGTQVTPDDLVAAHGADALRLHLMYLGPWDQGGPWNSRGIVGMERLIKTVFQIVVETAGIEPDAADPEAEAGLRRLTHRTIARVTTDLDDFQFNTMVAALYEFTNELKRLKDAPVARTRAWRDAVETLVLLMAPSTPYVAEELWERLGKPYSVHTQSWPVFDPEQAREQLVELVVQVNGKVRDKLTVPVAINEERARELALASDRVQEFVNGKEPVRFIYVPGRLANIVVR